MSSGAVSDTSFSTKKMGDFTFFVFADGLVRVDDVKAIRFDGDGYAEIYRQGEPMQKFKLARCIVEDPLT